MTNDIILMQRHQTPEEIELQTKHSELEKLVTDLAQKELEIEDVRLSVARFQHRYFAEVGSLYVKLDELRARIAECRARQDPDNPELEHFAEKVRDDAEKTEKEYRNSIDNKVLNTGKVEPSEDLKKLYRKIAIIVHPDKSVDEQSRDFRTALMVELNDAYARRDVDDMAAVHAKWAESPDSIQGHGIAVELVRTIRAISQVKRRIAEIEQVIADIFEKDIYQLMLKCREADAQGSNMLREVAEAIEAEIAKSETELQMILG